ncbi:hypothetical protein Tco_0845011, partial [Tanacetum coccineum]
KIHLDILSNGTERLHDLENLPHGDGDTMVRMEELVIKGKARDGQVEAREVKLSKKGSKSTLVYARFLSL